jgi:NADPH:quinone reductase-like Zn-dependent oxidoreductase
MSPQQKALVLVEKQGGFEVASRSIPSPGNGQLLVKVQSAALNPVDYKIQEHGIFVDHYPAVLGMDIAGTVEEVGEGVENFSKGDNVLDNSRVYPCVASILFTDWRMVPSLMTWLHSSSMR